MSPVRELLKDISYESVIDYDNGVKIPDEDKYSFKIASKDTILICAEGGSAGRKIAFTDQEVCFGNKLFALSTADKVNSRFIYYYYFSPQFQEDFASQLTGIIGGVSMAKFKKLKVPLPSPPEQQRIVKILEKAFVAIDKAKQNAEQNLRNAKEVFENYLQGVFEKKGDDWEEKTLGQVANHSLGKMLDKNKNKGILKKYLRNQSVRWFEFDLHDLTEMPFLEDEKEKYTAIKGDVLICEGGYPGRAAIWQENYPIYFQKAIHRVRFHESVYNKWFLYYLFVSDSLGQLKIYFTGTGIQHFTGASLDKFILPIPPKNVVQTLVSKFDKLSSETKKLEAIYQQKLANLTELKKTILQKAFEGEL